MRPTIGLSSPDPEVMQWRTEQTIRVGHLIREQSDAILEPVPRQHICHSYELAIEWARLRANIGRRRTRVQWRSGAWEVVDAEAIPERKPGVFYV